MDGWREGGREEGGREGVTPVTFMHNVQGRSLVVSWVARKSPYIAPKRGEGLLQPRLLICQCARILIRV